MGAVISHLRGIYTSLTALIRTLSALNARYGALLERVHAGPFLPVEKPTESFWMRDPPFPEMGDVVWDGAPSASAEDREGGGVGEDKEEMEVDVVVVGSGITGVAAVKTILELSSSSLTKTEGQGNDNQGNIPKIIVLEARQLCSGATARNGGHIKCAPHEEFARLRRMLGDDERARKVVRLQMRHLSALKEVGERMPLGEVREVETVDLFLDGDGFERAGGNVDELRRWMPEVDVRVWEGEEEMREKFGVNRHVVGAISYQAGALWPYRLVTSLWHDLKTKYPSLTISTHTPVSSITPNASLTHPYTIHTPRGKIRTRHVLHATNAYAGHLVPALRGCLTGVLGHMTAQKPGKDFSPVCHGERSWSVMYGTGFDYVTQRPDGEDGQPGELMLGGGLFRSKEDGLDQVGVWDDGRVDAFPLMHLRGSMAAIFEPRWGAEGKLEGAWSGIMGFTGDMLPFVGGLPVGIGNGRRRENVGGVGDGFGEWIAAGFSGEGMVWAWLSGVAVGIMMMGREEDELVEGEGRPGGRLGEWFPVEEVRVDAGRLRRARLENLVNEV